MRETKVPAAACRDLREGESVRDDMREQDARGAPAFAGTLIAAVQRYPEPTSLLSTFVHQDDKATGLLTLHRVFAFIGVWSGGAALILSIAQLGIRAAGSGEGTSITSFWMESAMIAIVFASVVWALAMRYQRQWLLARYNAEQLRLVKWRLFASPDAWSAADASSLRERIAHDIRMAVVSDTSSLEDVAQKERPIEVVSVDGAAEKDAASAARYYCVNRLDAQIRYFKKKASEAEKRWWQRPILAPFFFTLSLCLVFVHLILEAFAIYGPLTEEGRHLLEVGSVGFVTAAAAVPAFWASVRTWRSTNEFKRNAYRARAKQGLLDDYRERLLASASPNATFGTVGLCEGLFAQEQGEWLRLMLEAEWY